MVIGVNRTLQSFMHWLKFTALLAALGAASCGGGKAQQKADAPAKDGRALNKAPPKRDVGSRPGPDTDSAALLKVDDSVPAAADVQQRLTAPRTAVEAEMREVMGQSARALRRGKPESLLGNLVADIMRTAAAEFTGQPVHMAFTNMGGLRADLPKGPLTRGAVMEVLPFDNSLVVFELGGADLALVVQRMASRGGDPISGVQYRLGGGGAEDIQVNGKPLDPAATYRVCTNDYILDGGGKYEALKRAVHINRTGILIRDVMVDHIVRETAAGRLIDSSVGGRVRRGSGAPAQDDEGAR